MHLFRHAKSICSLPLHLEFYSTSRKIATTKINFFNNFLTLELFFTFFTGRGVCCKSSEKVIYCSRNTPGVLFEPNKEAGENPARGRRRKCIFLPQHAAFAAKRSAVSLGIFLRRPAVAYTSRKTCPFFEETLMQPSAVGQRIFCRIRAVRKVRNTSSISTLSKLSPATKSLVTNSCRLHLRFL